MRLIFARLLGYKTINPFNFIRLMKSFLKTTAFVVSAGAVISLSSCDNKSNVSDVELANAKDSMSYALGVSVGNSFDQMDLKDMNYETFLRGIKDRMDSVAAMELEEAEMFLQHAFLSMHTEMTSCNTVNNDRFCANNRHAY